MNIRETVRGGYQPVGNLADAELAVGNSFGTVITPQGVNGILARQILDLPEHIPVMADRMLVNAFPDHSVGVIPVEGPIATTFHKNVGSEGVVVAGLKYMRKRELQRVVHFAHAGHIGQVVLQTYIQAHKLGMKDIEVIVPPDLPYQFDRESRQWWTTREELWVPRAATYLSVLRAQRRIKLIQAAIRPQATQIINL